MRHWGPGVVFEEKGMDEGEVFRPKLVQIEKEECWFVEIGQCKECGGDDADISSDGVCDLCWSEPIRDELERRSIKRAIADEKNIPFLSETNRIIATANLKSAKELVAKYVPNKFKDLWETEEQTKARKIK
jgi:hypothetical protein